VELRSRSIGFSHSSTAERPKRLLRNGRAPDQAFRWHHLLYQRCTNEDVCDTQILSARIKYDAASSNWSKYAKPWDVIFDHPNHGIIQHAVVNLPQELPKNVPVKTKPKLHSFRPVHVPEDLNYSHTEIQAFHGNEKAKKIGELAKKEFRTLMAQCGVVLFRPTI